MTLRPLGRVLPRVDISKYTGLSKKLLKLTRFVAWDLRFQA